MLEEQAILAAMNEPLTTEHLRAGAAQLHSGQLDPLMMAALPFLKCAGDYLEGWLKFCSHN